MKELTPDKYRCGFGQCPGVYLEEDGKHAVVIGQFVRPAELVERIGPDESAIRIDYGLLVRALAFALHSATKFDESSEGNG